MRGQLQLGKIHTAAEGFGPWFFICSNIQDALGSA